MASLFSSAAPALTAAAPALGVDTALSAGAMPASVMPLSQQIAGMSMPALQTPTVGGEVKLPSLGVDTSVAPKQEGPGLLAQLGSGLQGAGDAYKNVTKGLQQQKPMEMMQLGGFRGPVQLQQSDLLSLLRNMGGY